MLDQLDRPHRSADEDKGYCDKAKNGSAQLLSLLRKHHAEVMQGKEPEPPIPDAPVVRELPPMKEPWFGVFPDDVTDRILIADITKACARRFKIPLHDLRSHSRVGGLIRARFIMYFLACALSGRSSVYVGRRLGRDHATILHGKKLVEKWREKDTCVEMDLRTIAASVGGSLDG
jgi:hypothetical protein